MFVVGLTGGIGSGKSAAAEIFAALGTPVVDTDAIAHALTAPGQPALQRIASVFGGTALTPDGSLNRPWLRQQIFAGSSCRKQLEAILHPLIRAQAQARLAEQAAAPYQILVVPLLFETGAYASIIQRSLLIDCEETQQIHRAMARSHLTDAEVRAIMAAQYSRTQRLALADDVIHNDGTLEELAQKIRECHEKYIKACTVS